MPEEQNIEQSLEDGKCERPEEVNENISLQETIEQSEPQIEKSEIPKSEIENMEVHHHPDLHHRKKHWKEYFLEFLMIFLAVTMGFFAESLREHLVNNEKEKNYMESMIKDLKKDTASGNGALAFQAVIIKKIDSALSIPVEKLSDISTQDTFYHHFVYFYSWVITFTRYDNTITQLKNAGGFSVIRKKAVIDSISDLNILYEGFLINSNFYLQRWQRLDEFAMQMIVLPEGSGYIQDSIYTGYPHHAEMFTRYDRPLLQQLYSFIRFEKSDLEVTMYFEMQYRDKAARLIELIKREYHLKDE